MHSYNCKTVKQKTNNIFFTFQYICYPWKNDDQIDPKNRRKTCRQDDDCDAGQECFRHHDKRMVNRGLCFDEVICFAILQQQTQIQYLCT